MPPALREQRRPPHPNCVSKSRHTASVKQSTARQRWAGADRPAARARESYDWHATGADKEENEVRRCEARGTLLLSVQPLVHGHKFAQNKLVFIETAVITVGYNIVLLQAFHNISTRTSYVKYCVEAT